MRLAGVLDEGEIVARAELQQGIDIGRLTVEVNGDDRPGPRADRGRDLADIEGRRLLVAVDEHRPAPSLRTGSTLAKKVFGGNDHLVSLRDSESLERKLERRRAGATPMQWRVPQYVGELLLEERDLLPEDVARGGDRPQQRRVDLVLDREVLALEIQQREHRRTILHESAVKG